MDARLPSPAVLRGMRFGIMGLPRPAQPSLDHIEHGSSSRRAHRASPTTGHGDGRDGYARLEEEEEADGGIVAGARPRMRQFALSVVSKLTSRKGPRAAKATGEEATGEEATDGGGQESRNSATANAVAKSSGIAIYDELRRGTNFLPWPRQCDEMTRALVQTVSATRSCPVIGRGWMRVCCDGCMSALTCA